MRSWRSLLVVAVLGACGGDSVSPSGDQPPPTDPDVCDSSYLTYDNFAAAFTANWCRGCHASAIPDGGRQGAPLGVNFDTDTDLRTWAERIRIRATGDTPTMPPAGGPGDEERALLVEWIDCGMD